MSKKKILHIIQSLGNGGCENMLLRTLPLLNDFEHKIVTLKEAGELSPKFLMNGISVETVYCHSLFDIQGILRLRKLVQNENPNIIITYLFHADMLGRLAIKSIVPVVPFLRTTYNHPKYLIARIFEWLTKPLVNKYLANSEAVKDFYVNHIGISPEKITVIPNGIDTDYFDSIQPDLKLKETLGITTDDFVIICVANLHPNKGHRYLLEAFESLYSEDNNTKIPSPTLKLLLIGDGIELKNLKKQIENYQSKSNIFFLGRRNDVPSFLKISDLFILPTLFEGMSNAVMEAMASGLPIITTDIPENRQLLTNNLSGILVAPKCSESIKVAVENIYRKTDTKNLLSSNGRKTILENFSLTSVINKLRKFYLSYK